MIFKIIFNNNTSLIQARSKIASYDEMIKAVISCRPSNSSNFVCEYKDSDGDLVRMNCEEDFKILLEDLEGFKKSVKIYVYDNEETSLLEQEEVPELKEDFLLSNSQEVTISEEVTEIQQHPVTKNPEKLFEEISIEKPSPKKTTQEPEQETCELKKEWFEKNGQDKKEWWMNKCKEKKEWWKKHCKGKKEWFKQKFEKKFDESIQKAIPQIAVHVAQILRNNSAPVESLQPLKDEQIHSQTEQAVHKGYECDGCGVGPIIGVCYMCSVCKDFDFCAKCEATIPHAHPFLKLRTPEQRPHALIAVINEEGKKPFVPEKDIPHMMKNTMKMFQSEMGDENMKKMIQKGQKMFKMFMGKCKKNKKNCGDCPMKNMKFPMCPMQNMMKMFNGCKPKQNDQENTMSFEEQMLKEAMKLSMQDLDQNNAPEKQEKCEDVLIEDEENSVDVEDLYDEPVKQPKKQTKQQPKCSKNNSPQHQNFNNMMQQGQKVMQQVFQNSKKNGQSPFVNAMQMMQQAQSGQNGQNCQNPMKNMFDMFKCMKKPRQQPKTNQKSFEQQMQEAIDLSNKEQEAKEEQEAMNLSLQQEENSQEEVTETPKHEKESKNEDLDETKIEDVDQDNDSSEGVVILDEPEKAKKTKVSKKPSIQVEDVNQINLANTNQLMEIFSIDSQKKAMVMEWVANQKTEAINELLNLFMDQMMGKL